MQSEHVVLLIVAMPFNTRVYQLPLIQQPLFRSFPRALSTADVLERVFFGLDPLA